MNKSLIFTFLLFCAATLHAKDYTLIKKLPDRLVELQKQAHKGWDTGNTGVMREATGHYNEALILMIKDLAKAYYPKDYLPADHVDAYLKALYTLHHFKQDAANPSGEFQGTAAGLEVPSAVSDELLTTISDIVQAISERDPGFDFPQWKKSWEHALKQ